MTMAAKLIPFPLSFFFLLSVWIFGGFNFSEAHKAPAMYVFGDSLVDVGNNNHLLFSFNKANFPPHGIDFPQAEATGRFSNGKNSADFLGKLLFPWTTIVFYVPFQVLHVLI